MAGDVEGERSSAGAIVGVCALLLLAFAGCSGVVDERPPGDAGADAADATVGIHDASAPQDAGEPPRDGGRSTDADVHIDAGLVPADEGPTGFAAVSALGIPTTTGGAGGEVVTVTTASELNESAGGDTPRIVQVSGTIEGDLRIGSNKTVRGLPGATLRGTLQINDQVNVIVQDLTIVGYNCSDTTDCGDGSDAVVVRRSHHLWFDHLDISDGSDGNFDMRDADYATVSWTKFSYSPERDPGAAAGHPHRFSNLVTSDALAPYHVTFHHCWWADRVESRTPRVTWGRVHVFNNLYTSEGNNACIQISGDAQVRTENNHFFRVDDPIEIGDSANAASAVVSTGNLYEETTGDTADHGGEVFAPPYPYELDAVTTVRAAIMAGAGPR